MLMKQSTPSGRVLYLVERDVSAVKNEAMGVFRIDPEFGNVEFAENKKARLGVLAIIGPGNGFGRRFPEALLAEIGVSRTRPYHEALGLSRGSEESNIPARRKWFGLTQSQYEIVAPHVFQCIQRFADERIALWKCGPDNPFFVKTPRHYWLRSKKTLFYNEGYKPRLASARFSISTQDVFFLKEVFSADLNVYWKERLPGLAKFVDLRLAQYRTKGYRRSFRKLGGVKNIISVFDNQQLPRYALEEMLDKYLPHGRANKFFHELAELIGWNGEKAEERKLADEAVVTSPNLKLKVISGLSGRDFIVFEIFSSKS